MIETVRPNINQSMYKIRHLVEPRGTAGVAVDLCPEPRHRGEIGIVPCEVDVEALHVVRRAIPPIARPVRSVVRVVDDGRLAVLRPGRSVEVEAIQPGTRAV